MLLAASLLDNRAGTIQPLGYVRGLAVAALGAGAAVYTGTPIVATEQSGKRWIVRTPSGTIIGRLGRRRD